MLDTNPATPEPDGVSDPHLTGVWTARRDILGDQPDYDRAAPFRRWLVSTGNPEAAERLDLAQTNTLVDPVTLARATTPTGGDVRAGRVRTNSGAYAWWVGDENCKAHVGMRDDADRSGSSDIAELLAGMASPGSHAIRSLEGFEEFPSNTATSDKVITRASIDLANGHGGSPADFFHDLSPYSSSVLADVTKGALRQDLSLYLERQNINWLEGWGWPEGKSALPAGPLGPNGQIALSNPMDYDVLSWKSLRHWYQMHRRQILTGSNLPLRAMRNYVSFDPVSNPTWNSGVLRITPVLARMQMIVSYGVRKTASAGGSSTYKIYMYSYPVLTLWNPYSVGLRVEQWSLFLHTLPLEHTIYQNGSKINLTGSGTRTGNYNWGWPSGNMVMRFGDAGTPSITFAPGEAKVLSYVNSTSNDFNAHNMVAGLQPWLPPSPSNPQGHAGQAREIGTITGQDSDRLEIQTTGSSWHTSANSFSNFQITFGFRTESKAVHRGHPDEFRKQMFTSQVGWRCEADAGNPVPDVISRSNFPSMTLGQLNDTAAPFLHLDVRLKTLDEVTLPNKTWLHTIPQHPFVAATSTKKHSDVDAATTFSPIPTHSLLNRSTASKDSSRTDRFSAPATPRQAAAPSSLRTFHSRRSPRWPNSRTFRRFRSRHSIRAAIISKTKPSATHSPRRASPQRPSNSARFRSISANTSLGRAATSAENSTPVRLGSTTRNTPFRMRLLR